MEPLPAPRIEELFRYDPEVRASIEKALGGSVVEILNSLLQPPKRLYLRVNTIRASREKILDMIFEDGYRAWPDYVVEEAVYLPVEGPEKIEILDKLVHADKRASESVIMGSHLYAPGVLGCKGVAAGDPVTVVSENGIPIAVGRAEKSCTNMLTEGRGVAVKVERSLYKAPPVRELRVWKEGLVYPQSLPSMAVSKILGPSRGERIFDMCAAPGGKTGHVVELSRGEAVVYAFDHSSKRIQEMVENLERLGHLGFVIVRKQDSRYISRDLPSLVADKIILDPPCSSTGVRPKLWHRLSSKDLENLVKYQEQLLREAHRILRRGGVLVYSTCSITSAENEDLLDRLIGEGLFKPQELPGWVLRISKRVSSWSARFDPRDGHPGFFIALLRKP